MAGNSRLDHLSLLRSELKVNILMSLLKSAKRVADFRVDIPDTRDTTILHVLEEFESLNIITKNHNVYQLTPLGIIDAELIKEYMGAMEVTEKFANFWAQHKVVSLPSKLLLSMRALKDGELVQTSASELGVVHQKFVEFVQQSNMLCGAAPIFHPDFVLLVGQLLSQGNIVRLIVTTPVLDKITNLVDINDLKHYIDEGDLDIFIKEDLEFALAVTDKAFSLGLFMLNGKYDDGMDLIAFSEDALCWGQALFTEALKSSKRLELDLQKNA